MITRTVRWTLSLALAGCLGSGCQKAPPPPSATETTTEVAGQAGAAGAKTAASDPLSKLARKVEDKVAAVAALARDERKALTPEEYERLLLSLASCSLKDRGIDPACAAHRQFQQARSRNTSLKDLAGLSSSLGLKHLGHASPAVRLVAAGLLASLFGSKPEAQEAVVKAAATEKEPAVIAGMLRAVGSSAKANPKVAELLLKMADHEAEMVRVESLSWLSSSWSAGVPGALEKVMEKIEQDPSLVVRKSACQGAGRSGAEKLVPLLKKLTKNPEEQPERYSACMQGLIDLWNGFVPGDRPPSQAAYRLSLDRLRDKPRSQHRPPWTVMSSFGRVPRSNPPWYKAQAVAKALLDVALDEKANWMARAGAARALGELKAAAELEQLQRALATQTAPESKHVARATDEALAKAR